MAVVSYPIETHDPGSGSRITISGPSFILDGSTLTPEGVRELHRVSGKWLEQRERDRLQGLARLLYHSTQDRPVWSELTPATQDVWFKTAGKFEALARNHAVEIILK